MLRSIASAFGRSLRALGSRAARLANADTATDAAILAGWAMATHGFGQVEPEIGWIFGGISLAAGAFFTARGSE